VRSGGVSSVGPGTESVVYSPGFDEALERAGDPLRRELLRRALRRAANRTSPGAMIQLPADDLDLAMQEMLSAPRARRSRLREVLRLAGPGLIGAGIVTFVAVGRYAQEHAHVPAWLRMVPVATFLAGCVTTVIGTLPGKG
jgi:hypothetical protein